MFVLQEAQGGEKELKEVQVVWPQDAETEEPGPEAQLLAGLICGSGCGGSAELAGIPLNAGELLPSTSDEP